GHGVANGGARGAARRFSVVTVASALALVLALLLVSIAVWTVVTRRTFAAVEGFVAYGLLLSIAWVALSAIDVALTEAAIGGGLTRRPRGGGGAPLATGRARTIGRARRSAAALARSSGFGGGSRGDRVRRPITARSRTYPGASSQRTSALNRSRQRGHRRTAR